MLTDVTLTHEDTNSILTDNTNTAIQGNIAMQVTQPGGQVCNLCKWRHLMANIRTNASDPVESKIYIQSHLFQSYQKEIQKVIIRIMDSAGRHRATSKESYWTNQVGMMAPQHWQPPQKPQFAAGIWQYCGV